MQEKEIDKKTWGSIKCPKCNISSLEYGEEQFNSSNNEMEVKCVCTQCGTLYKEYWNMERVVELVQ